MAEWSEEEHLRYHLEVSFTCGQPGCDWVRGLEMHFQALTELPEVEPS